MSRPLAYCTNSSQSNPTLTFRLASKPLVLRLERLDLRPELTPVVLDLGELLEVSLERTVVLSRHVLRQAEERDRGDGIAAISIQSMTGASLKYLQGCNFTF